MSRFFKPLKSNYSIALNDFVSRNGRCIATKDLVGIFRVAYEATVKIDTIINGFRATGIHPLNSLIFDESDYIQINGSSEESELCNSAEKMLEEILPTPRLQKKQRVGNTSVIATSKAYRDAKTKRSKQMRKRPAAECNRPASKTPSTSKAPTTSRAISDSDSSESWFEETLTQLEKEENEERDELRLETEQRELARMTETNQISMVTRPPPNRHPEEGEYWVVRIQAEVGKKKGQAFYVGKVR